MTLQEQIDDVMDYFDFYRVKQVMDFLDWKWKMDDDFRVPDIPEMRKRVRHMIQEAKSNVTEKLPYIVAQGGFEVKAYTDSITVKFVVEEWETFPDS